MLPFHFNYPRRVKSFEDLRPAQPLPPRQPPPEPQPQDIAVVVDESDRLAPPSRPPPPPPNQPEVAWPLPAPPIVRSNERESDLGITPNNNNNNTSTDNNYHNNNNANMAENTNQDHNTPSLRRRPAFSLPHSQTAPAMLGSSSSASSSSLTTDTTTEIADPVRVERAARPLSTIIEERSWLCDAEESEGEGEGHDTGTPTPSTTVTTTSARSRFRAPLRRMGAAAKAKVWGKEKGVEEDDEDDDNAGEGSSRGGFLSRIKKGKEKKEGKEKGKEKKDVKGKGKERAVESEEEEEASDPFIDRGYLAHSDVDTDDDLPLEGNRGHANISDLGPDLGYGNTHIVRGERKSLVFEDVKTPRNEE